MGTSSDFEVYPDRAKARERVTRAEFVRALAEASAEGGARLTFTNSPGILQQRASAYEGPRDVGRSARAFFDAQQLQAAREDHEAGR